ncbi:MAG: phosphomannomutase/phosphoglucomutase [Candidatus Dependentiae bacterium]|nr:phosphomannomutase/phosphoglucomutase [Candidatus Dependentiae bacterium]
MDIYKKLYMGTMMVLTLSAHAQKGNKAMQDVIFREYDIRGKVGSELIVEETYGLARAIAWYLVEQQPSVKKIAIGMDGRTHSPAIKEAMTKGFMDSGLDVSFIGVCPTPALYFTMHTKPFDAGIMITASHNPKEYNGMKICLGKESIWGKKIQEIKHAFKQGRVIDAANKGTYTEQPMVNAYVDWLVDKFKHIKGMKLSAVVDCGNGAAGTVLPDLVKKMGWAHVMLLYAEVDGTYPNHEADPTVHENMCDVKAVLERSTIDIGIGLDGDADRMSPMTKNGFLVPGDQLLALFAKQVVEYNPGASVVFDIKGSSGLIEMLEKMGAKPCISPAGHSIIKDMMKQHHALLGGELSCHFFFHDRYFGYDDGIYAMLRLFELLVDSGKTLEELLADFPKKYSSPEFRVPCDEDKKHSVVAAVKDALIKRDDVQAITIDGVRATMPYGWGLVRVSNTQPALTIRFESSTPQGLQQVKQDFYDVLCPYFDASWLKKQLDLL